MGIYINPGNKAFQVKRNGKYVDKSGLISVVNRTIGLPNKLSCISRPRRFGKSYAAQMLYGRAVSLYFIAGMKRVMTEITVLA